MTEQRRKYEKDTRDAERAFDRAKRDWQVTWRDDDRHQRDSDRLADQNNRKRERDQREADRELTQLERLIEKREKDAAQRYEKVKFVKPRVFGFKFFKISLNFLEKFRILTP